MKIALIKPPATYADWYRRPLLGIGYVSACLAEGGFESRVFDAYFNGWPEEELVRRVTDYAPDAIGITAMTHEIAAAAAIASCLKRIRNVPVAVGGCHVTALPKETLAQFPVFDYGICGEGEKTALELAAHLKGGPGSDPGSIKGLVFRRGADIMVSAPRPFLTSEELDRLPLPAMRDYYDDDRHALAGRHAEYVMFTSRGCPYGCAFCMQVLGRTVRRRSARNICDEIEGAVAAYGAHTVNFADEIFLFDNPQTRAVLEMMIERGLPKRIRWSGLSRANLVTTELIGLAKRAGCYRVEMGVESGDDGILKEIDKAITVAEVRRAVKVIKDAGIALDAYFILGHPHETARSLEKTADLAAELDTDTIAVGVMVPYPGTRIYGMALRGEGGYRLLSKDWSEYDKYGGRILELESLPYDELVRWQRRVYWRFFVKNRRFLDMARFLWKRKRALGFFMKKQKSKRRVP